jgi:hypothetical protein
MRDDQRLADANPWWRAIAGRQDPTAWTEHDPVLKGRATHDLGSAPMSWMTSSPGR